MSRQNKSSFVGTLAISFSAVGCAAGLLLSVSTIVTHGHGVDRGGNNSPDSRYTATLRVSDSPEGSRVVLTADQSLNSYEAYRRGDRFYIEIPLSYVPHPETVQGRAFTDVKVERFKQVTILSFGLPRGGMARVEEWSDRLEIVFVAARGRVTTSAAPAARPTPVARRHVTTLRSNDSPQGSRVTISSDQSLMEYEAYRRTDKFCLRIPATEVPRVEAVRGRGFADVSAQRSGSNTLLSFRLRPPGATARVEQKENRLDVVFTMPGAQSPASHPTREVARNNAGPVSPAGRSVANLNSPPTMNSLFDRGTTTRSTLTPKPGVTPKSSPAPSPSPSAQANPSAVSKVSPVDAQQKVSASPAMNNAASQQPQGFTWKQRLRSWILLAQLNPVPVAIGAGVLLLLIGLAVFQRQRAKATRPVGALGVAKNSEPAVQKPGPAVSIHRAKPAEAAAPARAAPTVTAASAPAPEAQAVAPVTSERHEHSTRTSDEVRKLMAGGDYDESVVASADSETRQLVGAELLSALVGRNLQRRERARAAFMKHGYFDDAARDLRIAESPNERAAAARRLSFVRDREATPHLVAALDDDSPEVRRAAVEALMDLRDPAAIAPLNSLMQSENDRKVPRSLIKHAIEACATTNADESVSRPSASSLPQSASADVPAPVEIEREVIEI
jgi:hypothetical protein